jgi:hypothetical protein
VTQLFILVGETPSGTENFWEVSYTSCALTATSGTGSYLAAFYDATSGGLLNGPTATSETC